jgi:Lrp/AsnC family leucine-responsive transcriptional regulator
MDQTDIEILKILQEEGRISMKALGSRVNLTSPAVSERVRKLEEKNIITGYKAIVDPSKLNLTLEAYIGVAMRPAQLSHFKKMVQEEPTIIECHHMTGHDSMTIRVLAKNTVELEELLGKIQKHGKTNTSIILSTPLDHKIILPRED